MYLQHAVKTSYLILDRTDYKQKYASVCSNMYFCSTNKIIFSTILQPKQNKHIAAVFYICIIQVLLFWHVIL